MIFFWKITFAAVAAIFFGCLFCAAAFWLCVITGPIRKPTFATYKEALAKKHLLENFLINFPAYILYPIWRIMQKRYWAGSLAGTPQTEAPVPVPVPVSDPLPELAIQYARFNWPQSFRDTLLEDAKMIVSTNPPTPNIDEVLGSTTTHLVSQLSLPVRPLGLQARFVDLVKHPRFVIDFFQSIKVLLPNTYRQFVTAFGAVEEAIKDHKIERDSPDHIFKLLLPTPAMRDAWPTVAPPPHLRFEGTWIVAPQGRGKTTLLSNLIDYDLLDVRDGKAALIVFDSKGDLSNHLRELKVFTTDLQGKLTLIEPSANLAINPLDIGASTAHTISLLEYVFAALLEAKATPLQSTLFRSVLILCKNIPNATFATFRQILQEGWSQYEHNVRTLHPDDRDFFLKGEFESKNYQSTKQELLWRIRDLTTRVPLLRDMFRAPRTKIDMGQLMDTPNVVIIDNSTALLAQEGSEFFSRFFIALILAAAQQRSNRQQSNKLPVYVYLDEAQTAISRDQNIATIIQTCRSQNVAMTFAHQELSQIKSDEVRSALANCAIRFTNPDRDAKALSGDFRTSTEFLQEIVRGSFALFVRDHTAKPVIVSVPNNPVSGWPKMLPAELHAIRDQMKARYSFTPEPTTEPDETTPWG